jgi:hypothetical protein
MIILLTEDTEGMLITAEQQGAMGCTYRFYIILREFYKKCIQFLATKEACLNYFPSICRHCGIVFEPVSTEAPQYLQKELCEVPNPRQSPADFIKASVI